MTQYHTRLLLLCEGDAETRNSWSGISLSVVRHLRAIGYDVVCGDVDLYGMDKLLAAVTSFARPRRRWWVRYHLSRTPFQLRSARARALAARHAHRVDAILQFGATFDVGAESPLPRFLYCDGNIELSARASHTGQSEAAFLTHDEIEEVRERERSVYARSASVFAISERVRESFITDFDLPPEHVHTVFAGPNWDIESALATERVIDDSARPVVLFVGRQFLRKGGDILLKAFTLVRARLPAAELVIVGPTDVHVSEPGVTVAGLIDKDTPDGARMLRDYYQSATCFCMPSRFEGLSISFMEAMAFGLPCIGASTEWAYPETIRDGETGLVVPLDDVEALANAMLRLLQDRELAFRYGAAGRVRVANTFTWPRVIAQMDRVIQCNLIVGQSSR